MYTNCPRSHQWSLYSLRTQSAYVGHDVSECVANQWHQRCHSENIWLEDHPQNIFDSKASQDGQDDAGDNQDAESNLWRRKERVGWCLLQHCGCEWCGWVSLFSQAPNSWACSGWSGCRWHRAPGWGPEWSWFVRRVRQPPGGRPLGNRCRAATASYPARQHWSRLSWQCWVVMRKKDESILEEKAHVVRAQNPKSFSASCDFVDAASVEKYLFSGLH